MSATGVEPRSGETVQLSPNRLIASSPWIVPEDRFDLLVHALSQLPERISLRIVGEGPDVSRIRLLGEACGVDDRLLLGKAGSDDEGDALIYPSDHNLSTAPIRPTDFPGPTLALARGPGAEQVDLEVSTLGELIELLGAHGDAAPTDSDDRILRGHRVAIVVNIPAHYRIPLFNGLAQRLSAAGAGLRVFFLAPTYKRRAWMRSEAPTFDREYLRSAGIRLTAAWKAFVPVNLGSRLRSFSPSLVLAAGFSPFVSSPAARYASRASIPFGIWSGEIPSRPTATSSIRTLQRQRLARQASFGVAYGTLAGEYLRSLRLDLPLTFARNSIATPGSVTRVSPPGAPLEILTVADMSTPGKRVEVLIDAMRQLDGAMCRLTVVGGGGGKHLAEERARGLDDRVRFVGAVPSDEVHRFFEEADVFAFPSSVDVFGLVLVEAMGRGLAVVTSGMAGAVPDLCAPGVNCLVVEEERSAPWARAFSSLAQDAALRERIGAAGARTIARRWTMNHSVQGLISGLKLGILGSDPIHSVEGSS